MLTTVYTLSFMDRVAMGLLMESIKAELRLSDTELGFLTGIAFAFFYATLGVPIARWADRGNRVTIVSMAIGVWGLAVMSTSVVTGFFQMVLVRIAAAVGEAGCMPPSSTLITDYFSGKERTKALSVFMAGISISILVAQFLAGWVNEAYGWRAAFLFIGAPGLVMALLVRMTIREPRAAGLVTVQTKTDGSSSLLQTVRWLWQQTTYRNLVIAMALVNLFGIGLGQWHPIFFIRAYGMNTGELGIWFGLLGGFSGLLGTYIGGYLATHFFSGNPAGQLKFIAVGVLLVLPCYGVMLLSSNKYVALAALAPISMMMLFYWGPLMALIQQLVPSEKRATAIAFSLLVLNLVGMGLGPQIVGLLSDVFTPSLGVDGLRVAMLISALVAIPTAWIYWVSSRTVARDIAAIEAMETPDPQIKSIRDMDNTPTASHLARAAVD